MTSKTTTSQIPRTVRSRQELADIFGLKDAARISRYVGAGMPVEPDGSYCVPVCLAWREANISARSSGDDSKRLLRWKVLHEREKTKLARLRRRELQGQMIDAHDVRPVVAALGRLAAEAMEFLKVDPSAEDSPLIESILSAINAFAPIQGKFLTDDTSHEG